MARALALSQRGLRFVDAGVSGGVHGLANGYCLMLGGTPKSIERFEPFARLLAPAPDTGWLHCGPSGAGHFVKMVHNGIEYGVMAAYAEGLNILKAANSGKAGRTADAETSPLSEPQYYQFEIDLPAVTEVWRHGSVIGSWLLDLTASALAKDAHLEGFSGHVEDSGEGRWTIEAAIEEAVPADVLAASLFVRFRSRQQHTFAEKVLSAMRLGFGGHVEAPKK
jgi:6-phosphogluconate dehydrogenase